MMELSIQIIGKDDKFMHFNDINPKLTIRELKNVIQNKKKIFHPNRQSLRLSPTGKTLLNSTTIEELEFDEERIIYLKDLGPQIGWKTVFVCEYIGPIFTYFLTYFRPTFPIIGSLYDNQRTSTSYVVQIAALCWILHYLKRIYETLFIHRFSHQTMPFLNLFKNCFYYWGSGFFVGYFINHPEYTEPYFKEYQVVTFLTLFLLCEIGNFSIHLLLRDLRPKGSTIRAIPVPNNNPLTELFKFVSCPNYTYEIGCWLSFSFMTQTLAALIFTGLGFFQMSIWALEKHNKYKREFENYPPTRKALVPFIF